MDFDPTIIDLTDIANESEFEYFEPFVKQIYDINIKDFDFDIFKKYVEELTSEEFDKLWDEKFNDLMKYINDNYLVVDLDEFEKSESSVKQVMFIEYIEFLMKVLSYKVVFAKYIKKRFDNLNQLEDWLSNKQISNDLALLLEEDIVIINNMYNMIRNTIAESKKAEDYLQRADKLISYIEYESNFRDYFISIVEDTEDEKLKDLILKYYDCEFIS